MIKNRLKQIALLVALLCMSLQLSAKDYRASMFGIKSDGVTKNTRAIQAAIDYVSAQGGGRLVFYVGRYLTGTVHLKSNVELRLEEGAILVGSTSIYDYDYWQNYGGVVLAYQQKNIAITGKGVIDGQGREVAADQMARIHNGLMKDELKYDRPTSRPRGVYMRECDNVTIKGITIKNAADWVQTYDQCTNLLIDSITVDSKAFWNNDGLDIVDCKDVRVLNSFIDATDDAICLKSHDATKMCENIEVRNCVARSSASGIKFGTVSAGGYKNIRIINNRVYDTHRSAFTIAIPDGGVAENILVDSLWSYNTSNPIYLRIGKRWGDPSRTPTLKNVVIQNVYAEVPATKADAGYDYEGPVEDMPRNISPSSIVGLPGLPIENVTLRNIEIVYPGGGDKNFAYRGLSSAELDSIPEMPTAYPEFSQFKELPAWGLYVRHTKGLTLENVTFRAQNSDYRAPIVLSDVHGATVSGLKIEEPGKTKKPIHLHKSTEIKQNK